MVHRHWLRALLMFLFTAVLASSSGACTCVEVEVERPCEGEFVEVAIDQPPKSPIRFLGGVNDIAVGHDGIYEISQTDEGFTAKLSLQGNPSPSGSPITAYVHAARRKNGDELALGVGLGTKNGVYVVNGMYALVSRRQSMPWSTEWYATPEEPNVFMQPLGLCTIGDDVYVLERQGTDEYYEGITRLIRHPLQGDPVVFPIHADTLESHQYVANTAMSKIACRQDGVVMVGLGLANVEDLTLLKGELYEVHPDTGEVRNVELPEGSTGVVALDFRDDDIVVLLSNTTHVISKNPPKPRNSQLLLLQEGGAPEIANLSVDGFENFGGFFGPGLLIDKGRILIVGEADHSGGTMEGIGYYLDPIQVFGSSWQPFPLEPDFSGTVGQPWKGKTLYVPNPIGVGGILACKPTPISN